MAKVTYTGRLNEYVVIHDGKNMRFKQGEPVDVPKKLKDELLRSSPAIWQDGDKPASKPPKGRTADVPDEKTSKK